MANATAGGGASLAPGEQASEGGPQHACRGGVQQRQAQRLGPRAARVEVVPAAPAGVRQQPPPVIVTCRRSNVNLTSNVTTHP